MTRQPFLNLRKRSPKLSLQYEFEKDQIKNKNARVLTLIFLPIFYVIKGNNPYDKFDMAAIFKLEEEVIYIKFHYKSEKDRLKMKMLEGKH